jgi:hypothetical protein
VEKPNFQITLEATANPINKESSLMRKIIFQRSNREAFLVGEDFEIIYKISNIGTEPFDVKTRLLTIKIQWANGQGELSSYPIPVLKPSCSVLIPEKPARWGVLAPGFSLFFARLETGPRKEYMNARTGQRHIAYDTSPLYRDEKNEIFPKISFFSIYGQNKEEFYQYWAMILAVLGLFYPILSTIFGDFTNWIYLLLLIIEIFPKIVKK